MSGFIPWNSQPLNAWADKYAQGKFIDLDALEELLNQKVIFKEQESVKVSPQTYKQLSLLYNEETLKKVILLHLWLPKYKEDVKI